MDYAWEGEDQTGCRGLSLGRSETLKFVASTLRKFWSNLSGGNI